MHDKAENGRMKIATSLSMLFDREYRIDACEMLKHLHDAGFAYIDMDFWDWSYDKRSPFIRADWADWVKRIRDCGDELGVTFHQSHAVDIDPFHHPTNREWNDELIRRCIVGSGMMGIDWIVFHCAYAMEAGESEETKIKRNREYITPLLELAAEHGVGIALENTVKRENDLPYAVCAEELCHLVDSFTADNIGVCWDTGHAHCTGLDQYAEITRLGRRLKALHVHDNDGTGDKHTAPFNGTIDWKAFMRGLRDAEYSGILTFEADTIVRNAPDAASKDAACRMMYLIGKHLVEMDA